MNQLLSKIISPFLGKKAFQRFFQLLHKISLKGMNIGEGADFNSSGEKFTLKLIKQVATRDYSSSKESEIIVFDIGANEGNYAELIIDVFEHPNLELHCFEPSRKTYSQLKKRLLGRFSESQNTKGYIHNFGFSDKKKKAVLYSSSADSGLSSVYNRNLKHLSKSLNADELVELTTVDDFCKQNRIGHIHFLKMDVEGHEISVFKGASKMIESDNIDFIQFEFGGCDIDSRVFLKDFYYLLTPKYRLFRILKNGIYEIVKYREAEEIFVTTNFLAIRKGAGKFNNIIKK